MINRKQILTELQEIAPYISKAGYLQIPYVVPAGYFDSFVENLMHRLHLENAGFSEPPAREIASISPILAGLKNKATYQVPPDFFDALKIRIPDSENVAALLHAVPGGESNNKSFPARKISLSVKLVRFAAAACIVALLGIAVFNTGNHKNTIDPIEGLTNVSDQDMANFLDADDAHWNTDNSSFTETATMDFSDKDIDELLSSVPDAELEKYLPQLPVQKRTVN
jgi:hypothetical protein